MANEFSKEERVAFENVLEGFQDAEVMSKNVAKYNTDQTMMERTNDIIWRPMPYIAQSINATVGSSISASLQDMTQLSVPSTIGYHKTVPWTMDALELRDALQEGRLGDAAKQKLASDINVSALSVASLQGTLVVPRTNASGSFDDVAACDAIMNEQGVPNMDRKMFLTTRDYNGMASNLAVATRSFTSNPKSGNAYEKAYVGDVAGFSTFKLDYGNSIAAAGGGATTIDTTAGAADYVPAATSTAGTGEVSNVDNRYQTITVSNSVGVVAGDCFTIDGCYAVHHITKQSTGQLKTFRVISVPGGGTTLVISPPIISASSTPSDAEQQYQNCTLTTTSATAAINWLNVDATGINPFYQKNAIELLPGRFAVPTNAGTAVMRGTTDSGLELVMQKWYDIYTMKTVFRMDVRYGVVMTNPEHAGILLFSQVP